MVTSLAGPDDPIIYPNAGKEIDYEAELVVVIGREARRVPEEQALDYVLGYTCGNDVSDRAIQREEMKFGCLFAGKAFDTYAPIGPVIATGLDPSNLTLIGRLNGDIVQHEKLRSMYLRRVVSDKEIAYLAMAWTGLAQAMANDS